MVLLCCTCSADRGEATRFVKGLGNSWGHGTATGTASVAGTNTAAGGEFISATPARPPRPSLASHYMYSSCIANAAAVVAVPARRGAEVRPAVTMLQCAGNSAAALSSVYSTVGRALVLIHSAGAHSGSRGGYGRRPGTGTTMHSGV